MLKVWFEDRMEQSRGVETEDRDPEEAEGTLMMQGREAGGNMPGIYWNPENDQRVQRPRVFATVKQRARGIEEKQLNRFRPRPHCIAVKISGVALAPAKLRVVCNKTVVLAKSDAKPTEEAETKIARSAVTAAVRDLRGIDVISLKEKCGSSEPIRRVLQLVSTLRGKPTTQDAIRAMLNPLTLRLELEMTDPGLLLEPHVQRARRMLVAYGETLDPENVKTACEGFGNGACMLLRWALAVLDFRKNGCTAKTEAKMQSRNVPSQDSAASAQSSSIFAGTLKNVRRLLMEAGEPSKKSGEAGLGLRKGHGQSRSYADLRKQKRLCWNSCLDGKKQSYPPHYA